MTDAARRRVGAIVFLVSALLFYVTPVRQLSDSYYSLLVTHQLVTHGTFDLASYFRGELPPDLYPGTRQQGLPYQVKRYGAKVLYEFPVGAPLLAVPWVAVADAVGAGVLDDDGRYDRDRERRHQRFLAAFCSAAFVTGVFAAAARLLSRRAALWTAAALMFATPVWSTASRGYWSHTAALALLGGMLPLLVAREKGFERGGLRLGLLAAGAYLCRPPLSILLALVAVDLLLRDRKAAARFALGAGSMLLGFVALSERTWGMLLPPYYVAARLGWPSLHRLAGVLFSPSRGLFVFEPALLVVLIYAARRWRELELRRLCRLGAVALFLHTFVVASFPHWWGGHGYGPRLFTETVFYQALLVLGMVATLAKRAPADRGWRRAVVVLAIVGVGIQAGGAVSKQGNFWDSRPREVDLHPDRLWDWSDPQWLAWWNTAPRLAEPPPEEPPAIVKPGVTPAPAKPPVRHRRRHPHPRRHHKQRRARHVQAR